MHQHTTGHQKKRQTYVHGFDFPLGQNNTWFRLSHFDVIFPFKYALLGLYLGILFVIRRVFGLHKVAVCWRILWAKNQQTYGGFQAGSKLDLRGLWLVAMAVVCGGFFWTWAGGLRQLRKLRKVTKQSSRSRLNQGGLAASLGGISCL